MVYFANPVIMKDKHPRFCARMYVLLFLYCLLWIQACYLGVFYFFLNLNKVGMPSPFHTAMRVYFYLRFETGDKFTMKLYSIISRKKFK